LLLADSIAETHKFLHFVYIQQQRTRTGRSPTGNISCTGFVEDYNTIEMRIKANKVNEYVDYEYFVCETADGQGYKVPMANEKSLKEFSEVESSSKDKLNYYSTTMLSSTKDLTRSNLINRQILSRRHVNQDSR
jgi:hypothetical protein